MSGTAPIPSVTEGFSSSPSMVDQSFAEAFPPSLPVAEAVSLVYRILTGILDDRTMEKEVKREYGKLLLNRVNLYMAEIPLDVVTKTTYQSAFNRMFNDFFLFTEPVDSTFRREAYGILSWKTLFSIGTGIFGYFRLKPVLQEKFRQRYQPKTRITSLTKQRAVWGRARASLLIAFGTYLFWSGAETFAKHWNKKPLKPCFPPYCPTVNLDLFDKNQ